MNTLSALRTKPLYSCVYTAVVISCLIGRFISRMKARFRSGRLDQT
jgi:hypothetical protein